MTPPRPSPPPHGLPHPFVRLTRVCFFLFVFCSVRPQIGSTSWSETSMRRLRLQERWRCSVGSLLSPRRASHSHVRRGPRSSSSAARNRSSRGVRKLGKCSFAATHGRCDEGWRMCPHRTTTQTTFAAGRRPRSKSPLRQPDGLALEPTADYTTDAVVDTARLPLASTGGRHPQLGFFLFPFLSFFLYFSTRNKFVCSLRS